MIHPTADLGVWAPFGLALGFSSSGEISFACVWCGELRSVAAWPPSPARAALAEMLAHVETCPKRNEPADPLTSESAGPGPVAVEVIAPNVFRPHYAEVAP